MNNGSLFGAEKISFDNAADLQADAPHIIIWAAPVMFFFVFIEYIISHLQHKNFYEKKETIDSLFAGHMANIGRLADEGKLIVAGPIRKNEKKYRGIFILNVKKEEAVAILDTDPAIKAKLLEPEIFEWYGSAALPVYLPYHEKLQKNKM